MNNYFERAYEQKLQAQLEEWKAQITLLNAEFDKAEADARIEYKNTIGNRRAKVSWL